MRSTCPENGQARRQAAPGLSGLTLVEVLVAITLLSLTLLAYLTVAEASRDSLAKGTYFTLAARAAGDKIATCQAAGYAGLTDGTTTSSVAGLPQGQMTTIIGPLDGNAANTNIKQVDVTVTWGASNSRAPQTAGRTQHSILISNRK